MRPAPYGSLRHFVAHWALTLGGTLNEEQSKDLTLGWAAAGGYFILSSVFTGFSNGFWKKVGAAALAGLAGAFIGRNRNFWQPDLFNWAVIKPQHVRTRPEFRITNDVQVANILAEIGHTRRVLKFDEVQTRDLQAHLNRMLDAKLIPRQVIQLEKNTRWHFQPARPEDERNAAVSYLRSGDDTYLLVDRNAGVPADTQVEIRAIHESGDSYTFPLTLT